MYRVLVCTLFEHNLALVGLATLVCAASFFVAGRLWTHVSGIKGRRRRPWTACLGLIAGGGTWATHFIAMLAYKPPVPIGFELGLTIWSFAIGVGFSWAAFESVYWLRGRWSGVVSGALFATGVVGLHYVGMAGLQAPALRIWAPDLVVASWLICMSISIAAMSLALRTDWAPRRFYTPALLALAVVALHFTGMGALTLAPYPLAQPSQHGALNVVGLSIMITIVVSMTLATITLLTVADHRISVAEAKNQAKSRFLATMSHELRTPLTSIISYAELLAEVAAEQGRKQEQADATVIVDASRRLLTLISEILDFSKLEAGKVALNNAPFAVRSLIEDVAATSRPLMDANQNQFEITIDDQVGRIDADRGRLRQCLLNLLSNAAKFTHAGRVTLNVSAVEAGGAAGVRFDVIDTGIGMSSVAVGRIFQPFTQADETVARRYGGTGLGLAITKELIEMMGGDISVRSQANVGSHFSIWAPCAPGTGANTSRPTSTQTMKAAA